MNQYEIHLVNQFTNTHCLHDLIRLAQQTNYFTIDTECDFYTNRPALIQLEFIHRHLSTIILIKVCHLPSDRQSLKFWHIRSILKFVFQGKNTIYSWGVAIDELNKFIDYGLFTHDALYQANMMNIQDEFKPWHRHLHEYDVKGNDKWGLQSAIVDRFH